MVTQISHIDDLPQGPFVMAGLTHDSRWLELDEAALDAAISEPDDIKGEELVSLQASWNSSLFVRHDAYHAHISAMEDGGDAIDATFRLVRGCHLDPSPSSGSSGEAGGEASASEEEHHMHHQMKVERFFSLMLDTCCSSPFCWTHCCSSPLCWTHVLLFIRLNHLYF